MPTIIDRHGGAPDNESGYAFSLAKWNERPNDVEEVDGYREKFRATEHQQIRLFKVPWSARRQFRKWALGYSTTSVRVSPTPDGQAQDQVLLLQARTWFGQAPPPPGASLPVVTPWSLNRVIPAQDPECPWLFCTDCDMVETKGAWIDDPDNVLSDANGQPILDGDGKLQPIPATAYVDNGEGGTFGRELVQLDVPLLGPLDLGGGAPSQRFRDGFAYYRCTFTHRPYEVRTDTELASPDVGGGEINRYVQREEKFQIEALPLARLTAFGNAPLKFVPTGTVDALTGAAVPAGVGGVQVPEAGIQQIPSAALTYTWHEVPDLPRSNYAACAGKINASPFDGYGGAPTYPAETLLCMPWQTFRMANVLGRVVHRIVYSLYFRPGGWNRYYVALGGGPYKATFGGAVGGPTVYQTADFSLLFKVPPPVRYV